MTSAGPERVVPRYRKQARRTPGEWARRGLIATVVAMIGALAVTFSLAQSAATGNPAFAYALASYDGRIGGRFAAWLAGPDASPADRERADAIARDALRHDATAVLAASTLMINAQLRGDTPAARRLMAYAEGLSRRDVQTQLWAIEDSVGRGDVAGALRHYDIALRTTPRMGELLFPVLASANSDPAIRRTLVRTLASKPPWGGNFIAHIGGNGPDPRAAAALFGALQRRGVAVSGQAQASVVNGLIASGLIDDAWSYYATIRPGADRAASRDPSFAETLAAPSRFDWVAIDDGTISTTIQPGNRGGLFDFAAPPGAGGPMLQQLQVLPPGSYRLTGHAGEIEQAVGSGPYWLLTCEADRRELGRVEMSGSAGGSFTGLFSVPPGCPLQALTLIARPSNAASGVSGQIDRIEVKAAR